MDVKQMNSFSDAFKGPFINKTQESEHPLCKESSLVADWEKSSSDFIKLVCPFFLKKMHSFHFFNSKTWCLVFKWSIF